MSTHQQQLVARLTGFISDAQELRARLVAMRDQLRQRREAPDDNAAREAYAYSDYGYNDAESLANLWGTSVDNAKLSIGLKLLGGDTKLLESALHEARIFERKLSEDLSDGDAELFERYADSGYGYDDAAALAALWRTDVYDAKLLIGTKLKHRDHKLLEELLYEARIHERKLSEDLSDGDAKLFELYADSRYSYDDAEALSKLWRTDVYGAKLRIGTKILHGDHKLLHSELLDARAMHDDPKAPFSDDKALSLYLTSSYAYNDADALARLWSVGVIEAKKAIGRKLRYGKTKLLANLLHEARLADKLSDTAGDAKLFELYADSPFSYDDAEALAALWGISVSDAKLQIGWKINAGDSALIRDMLRSR